MVTTDGTTTVLGVYHARLHRIERPQWEQFIDMRTAEHVGSVKHTGDLRTFDYLGSAEQYATPDAPAFNWRRDGEIG
jgi:hypothetical protein